MKGNLFDANNGAALMMGQVLIIKRHRRLGMVFSLFLRLQLHPPGIVKGVPRGSESAIGQRA